MFNLIQKFFSPFEKNNRNQIRKNFSDYFFSLPEHKWITGTGVEEQFKRLISLLPTGVLDALMRKYPVTFVRSADLKDQWPGIVVTNTVVIFPEFQKLINSTKGCAVAYLAHELAFVLYELEEHKFEPFMAEIEADKFVCDLGLSEELEDLLLMLDETLEKRVRLTYLTVHHFSKDN